MNKNVKSTELPRAGWPIPQSVKDQFTGFCNLVGSVAQEDCAGALWLWQYMPAQIREWAKLAAKEQPKVPVEFWEGMRAGMDKSLQSLLDSLQAKPPADGKPKAKL